MDTSLTSKPPGVFVDIYANDNNPNIMTEKIDEN